MGGMVQRDAAKKWARVVVGGSGAGPWIALAMLVWEAFDRIGDRRRRERDADTDRDDREDP